MLQALIVLFVAAPALVRGHLRDEGARRRCHGDGEGVGRHDRWLTATATRRGHRRIRDRADVRRQIKLSSSSPSSLAAARLLRADHRRPDRALHAGRADQQGQPGQGAQRQALAWGAVVVAAVALVLAALNRCPRARWACCSSCSSGWPSSPASWSGTTPTRTGPPAGDGQPAPRHDPDRHARWSSGRWPGVLCERAGVINIAIEGQFLVGAFFASVASVGVLSAEMGLLGGIARRRRDGVRCSASSRCATRSTRWCSASCWSRSRPASPLPAQPDPRRPEIKQYLNEPLVLERIAIPGLVGHPGPRAGRCSTRRCWST